MRAPVAGLRGLCGAMAALGGFSTLGGCQDDPRAVYPLPAPDAAVFVEEAGPLLVLRCAEAGCHGDPARPLALYAPGRWRRDPATSGPHDPLTPEEWAANFGATLGFLDTPHPRSSLLMQKALGGAGVGGHAGGAVFEAASDPEFRAIEQWARTGFPENVTTQ